MVLGRFDIVIVGGGPAGTFLAKLMGENGFEVALIDKKPYPNFWEKICGSVTGKTILKSTNLEEKFVKKEFSGFAVRDFNGEILSEVSVELVVIDRVGAGASFLEEVRDYGVKIFDRSDVRELVLSPKGVGGVGIKRELGEGGILESRVAIDASGVDGVLREKIKNLLPDATLGEDDLVMAYMEHLNLRKSYDSEMLQLFVSKNIAPGGYAWVTGLGREAIVGIGIIKSEASKHRLIEGITTVKNLENLSGEAVKAGVGLLPVRRAFASLVHNGFALVGDSGSQGNPFFGGGIEGAIDAAKIAYRSIRKSLEVSEEKIVQIDDLWRYNVEFMSRRGTLLGIIDLLRMLAQSLDEKELKTIAKNLPKSLQFDLYTLMSIGLKLSSLIFRPRFLWKTVELVKIAQKVRDIYSKYPKDPSKIDKWVKEINKVYKKFRGSISKM